MILTSQKESDYYKRDRKGIGMKGFHRIMAGIVVLMAVIILGVNLVILYLFHEDEGRTYRVEINRLQNEIAQKGLEHIDLSRYSSVKKIEVRKETEVTKEFYEGDGSDYVVRKIGDRLYRFDYEVMLTRQYRIIVRAVNLSILLVAAAVIAMLIFIRKRLLKPFHNIRELPYELSRGNLTIGLKENKYRYFGRFIWGLEMLREKLEKQRFKELELQKEKKTLILSISHDIKTPLSAISLYAKALSKNLYDSDEKRAEIADSIVLKAKEIENLVSDIMKASSEDFLNLEVHNTEFYLAYLMKKIIEYYSEKLSLLKIEFLMDPYDNCLLKGDSDRAVEVLQNIMENAIKYGDGGYIGISFTREEDCLLICVSNSGCTLSENELPHIFESFWRGSNTSNNGGSGLGLYICRQLMKQMDGSIYAQCHDDEMKVTVVLRLA